MADADRAQADAVELAAELAAQPWAFEFFAALRRWECAHPQLPRLGESTRPGDDPVRLAQEPALAFAPAMLAGLEPGNEHRPARLVGWFLGMFGPNGPMPLHLTEYARDRLRQHRDPTLARFADVFHHRMLSLFFRAWADAQPTVCLDRPEHDRFARYVGSLAGLGLPALRGRDALPDVAKLHYAGRLAPSGKNAEGLLAMVEEFFALPARIVGHVGRWMRFPADARWHLSARNTVLNRDAVLGEKAWGCQHNFRLVAGPLSLAQFRQFLPTSDSFARLVAMVRNYLGDEYRWELQLLLKAPEVPRLELGRMGQLGWTTWLATEQRVRDADDVVLTPPVGWDAA